MMFMMILMTTSLSMMMIWRLFWPKFQWTRALGALWRTSDPKSNEVRVDRKSGAQGRPDSPDEEGKPRASLTLPPYIQLHTSQVLESIQRPEWTFANTKDIRNISRCFSSATSLCPPPWPCPSRLTSTPTPQSRATWRWENSLVNYQPFIKTLREDFNSLLIAGQF